jgi:hypothetical protein
MLCKIISFIYGMKVSTHIKVDICLAKISYLKSMGRWIS